MKSNHYAFKITALVSIAVSCNHIMGMIPRDADKPAAKAAAAALYRAQQAQQSKPEVLVSTTQIIKKEPQPYLAQSEEKTGTCLTCFDDTSKLKALSCGHSSSCNNCLENTINTAVASNDAHMIKCPQPGCKKPLIETDLASIANPETRAKISKIQLLPLLLKHKDAKFCKIPHCSYVFLNEDGYKGTMPCPNCNQEICVQCSFKHVHTTSCADAAEMRELIENKDKAQQAFKAWVQKNAKLCPKCKEPIERNGGCNHIKCEKCKHDFCYDCLQPTKKPHEKCADKAQEAAQKSTEKSDPEKEAQRIKDQIERDIVEMEIAGGNSVKQAYTNARPDMIYVEEFAHKIMQKDLEKNNIEQKKYGTPASFENAMVRFIQNGWIIWSEAIIYMQYLFKSEARRYTAIQQHEQQQREKAEETRRLSAMQQEFNEVIETIINLEIDAGNTLEKAQAIAKNYLIHIKILVDQFMQQDQTNIEQAVIFVKNLCQEIGYYLSSSKENNFEELFQVLKNNFIISDDSKLSIRHLYNSIISQRINEKNQKLKEAEQQRKAQQEYDEAQQEHVRKLNEEYEAQERARKQEEEEAKSWTRWLFGKPTKK
jgi:hypothetical protein